jgi:2-polyprenyl-3-methyl-5-hydroxy-6-metoxy-1,4-benzoquinol methylase
MSTCFERDEHDELDWNIRPMEGKTNSDLSSEWDGIALDRDRQMRSGADISLDHVLWPAVEHMLRTANGGTPPRRLIDLGCGSGVITERMSRLLRIPITAVDLSQQNIVIAKNSLAQADDSLQIEYFATSAELFATECVERYDIAVAYMVLMDVLRLQSFLQAARRLTVAGGRFLFAMTHPCFWPRYWRYEKAAWFHYDQQIVIEAPFRISSDAGALTRTTHVHRPVQEYISAFSGAGYSLSTLFEPMPSLAVQKMYREKWEYPRFLLGECIAM